MGEKSPEESTILSASKIDRVLTRMAHEIFERHLSCAELALIGIHTRGAFIAARLADRLSAITKEFIARGALDVTLYRDDFDRRAPRAQARASSIDFDLDDKIVVLTDDVLFTGRTISAAMRALFDLGRPKRIELAILIDRGHRELPYRPDYCGKNAPTQYVEHVKVRLKEIDGIDLVVSSSDRSSSGLGR